MNVLFVPSEAPYHERKVTLLNGPHTVLSPVAYLSGINIVREACEHEVVGKYIHKVMFDELMETLNLPKEELKKFAEDVLERFNNPFVDHQVTSIMLNSFPKYENSRPPGLEVYLERKGELPKGWYWDWRLSSLIIKVVFVLTVLRLFRTMLLKS